MNSLRYKQAALSALLALALATGWFVAGGRAGAAPQDRTPDRPLRIVVANVPRIITEVREGVDFDEKFKVEKEKLAAENARMQEEIRNIQAQAGNFRPDSPQYEDLQKRFVEAKSKWKVWGETNTLDREMRKKRQIRILMDKVYAAISEYAGREGIDLVLADVQPNLTENEWAQIPLEQIGNIISQRRVLYSGKQLDITDAIIAFVDSKYRGQGAVGASGGGGGPVAGPGPVGGAAGGPASRTAPGPTDARPAGDAQPRPDAGPGTQRRPTNR